MALAPVAAALGRLALTAAIAVAAGWACYHAGLPAPYMLGSLFGVWLAGAALPRLRPALGIPRWFYVPVIIGLSVIMGANFKLAIVAQLPDWALSAAAMVATTAFVTALGMLVLVRARGYQPQLAFLCSIPGGQVEAVAIAREVSGKDYVVALFHLIRLVIIFLCTPLLLGYVGGSEGIAASNAAIAAMPQLGGLPPAAVGWFLALALGGYAAARLARLPVPHLFGPLLASAAAHLAGLVALPRINEFVLLAQVAVGAGVGARLAQVRFGELAYHLKLACLHTAVILASYGLIAYLLARFAAVDFLQLLLAFVPGGIYEVTLLALIFSYDVAFIAVHHTLRVILIFAGLPLAMRLLGGKPAR